MADATVTSIKDALDNLENKIQTYKTGLAGLRAMIERLQADGGVASQEDLNAIMAKIDETNAKADAALAEQNQINTDNNPVANAGPDQSVAVGTEVALDGTGSSDPQGGTLAYEWSQMSGPTVTLSDTTVVGPTFTPDTAGDHVFQLIVSNGSEMSAPDSVTVTVA